MNKKYEYEATEQSVDVRNFSIVSDRKLTWDELNQAICMPNITKEGSCETDDGITVTYLYTDFGDDSEFNVDGDIEEKDYE
tara:strand:- start:53 stop:295 length:243 start_codon:yes stop_codon:yes gene_type:complete